MNKIQINKTDISKNSPTYFIADIAANHDGDIDRAFKLISLAKEAGANAAKFQHFLAKDIVSDRGFRAMGNQLSHQAKWGKSVFDVYQDASLNRDWTPRLVEHCNSVHIDFFSSPYDFAAVDHLDPWVPAYKIGSGDITWLEILEHIAQKGKPVIIATGASTTDEVIRAVNTIEQHNRQIAIMQCNTNYTGNENNFFHISLNVLKTYQVMYPDYILGLSDHSPGHTTVLGAVALGARIVEKHFTDDTSRSGPDHGFSMDPTTWKAMVTETRHLEAALEPAVKRVEPNEKDTVVLQRRCIRAAKNLPVGHRISRQDVEVLRPAPVDAIMPPDIDKIIGKSLTQALAPGDHLTWNIIK